MKIIGQKNGIDILKWFVPKMREPTRFDPIKLEYAYFEKYPVVSELGFFIIGDRERENLLDLKINFYQEFETF